MKFFGKKIKKLTGIIASITLGISMTSCAQINVTSDINNRSDSSYQIDVPEELVNQIEEVSSEIEDEIEEYFYNLRIPYCEYSDGKVIFNITFNTYIPESDDNKIYLFDVSAYEDEFSFEEKEPVGYASLSDDVNIEIPYKNRYVFEKFVPAIMYEGEYVPVAKGRYISNIEELAENTEVYPEMESKKGFLVDGTTIEGDELGSLNVESVIYNIPLSFVVANKESEIPTIKYRYNGETYYFNAPNVYLYDYLFSTLTDKGYHCMAIVLNDWNEENPELIHPLSRKKTSRSLYYAMNTEEEEAVRLLEATSLFLAERYTNGKHGLVYDWVIGNEINQQKIWNYMDSTDVEKYTKAFEKSFRIFYNGIKSQCANAKVYFSLDHDWNDNDGNNNKFFNAKDVLAAFNEYSSMNGNYDWNLAIHPYPEPLTNVKFWEGEFDKTEDARQLTPMNLSTITSVLTKDEYLNTDGKVRDIAITELGFTSTYGEDLQAAAYAYCYYIVANNDYITAFVLNRQTDSPEEMKSNLATGIYKTDYTPKELRDVFANIDSPEGEKYIPQMLEIIGEDSLEEALERAN